MSIGLTMKAYKLIFLVLFTSLNAFGQKSCLEQVIIDFKYEYSIAPKSYSDIVTQLKEGSTLLVDNQIFKLGKNIGEGEAAVVFHIAEKPNQIIKIRKHLDKSVRKERLNLLSFEKEEESLKKLEQLNINASTVIYLSKDKTVLIKSYIPGEAVSKLLDKDKGRRLHERPKLFQELSQMVGDLEINKISLQDVQAKNLIFDGNKVSIIDPGPIEGPAGIYELVDTMFHSGNYLDRFSLHIGAEFRTLGASDKEMELLSKNMENFVRKTEGIFWKVSSQNDVQELQGVIKRFRNNMKDSLSSGEQNTFLKDNIFSKTEGFTDKEINSALDKFSKILKRMLVF